MKCSLKQEINYIKFISLSAFKCRSKRQNKHFPDSIVKVDFNSFFVMKILKIKELHQAMDQLIGQVRSQAPDQVSSKTRNKAQDQVSEQTWDLVWNRRFHQVGRRMINRIYEDPRN